MNISRDIKKELSNWYKSESRLPLIIKGARQVGKTFAVNQFLADLDVQSFTVNFDKDPQLKKAFLDSSRPEIVIENLEFITREDLSKCKVFFFDEIQECPEALRALKYFAEDSPEIAVICAGSLLGVALNESSYPVGKVTYLWLGPLTFSEFLNALGDSKGFAALSQLKKTLVITSSAHDHLMSQLKKFYVTGGLPRVVTEFANNQSDLKKAFSISREIQNGLLRDYYADFSKHSAGSNALHVRTIFENIPVQLAKTEDASTAKFKFSDVIKGKKGYAQLKTPIEWLDKAGLAYKINIANRSEVPLLAFSQENFFKIYLFDIGILGALLRLEPESIYLQNYGVSKGYFAENLVLQALIKNDLDKPFCWEEGQSEIEFLIQYQGDIIPIEVKSGHRTKAKSLSTYISRYKPKAAVKFYAGMPKYSKETKLHNLPLYLAWDLSGKTSIELF